MTKTIGNWGCLMVSYDMQARYWELCDDLPDQFLARMKQAGAMSGPYMNAGALRTTFPDKVTYDGYLTRDSSNMRPKIKQWLDAGRPVPARVDFNPTTDQWEQHWVLLTGYFGEDFWMADPWYGDIEVVNNRYPISGSDVIEAVFYRLTGDDTPPPGQTYDMTRYLFGKRDGRALQLSSGETVQYQEAGGFVYCVKNSQWEQFRYDGSYIWRGKDTSPGGAPPYAERPGELRYYWQKETGQNAARWCPRYMTVGQVWTGFGHFCQYYYKNDCSQSAANTGNNTNKATLIAHHPTKTWGNLTVHDVLEFKGVGDEHFWLILDWGMGGWSAEWGESHVTELFQPGQRTLVRESGCYG